MFYGVDAGSTYVKVVGLDEQAELVDFKVFGADTDADKAIREYLRDKPIESLVGTGYGRHMVNEVFGVPVVSEIKAHAKGAHYFFPEVKTVVDLGGQDSKVVKVAGDGNFSEFRMNDKCAAGTGKFIEMAAARLGIPLENMAEICGRFDKKIQITSMCAVFAESEVISLVAKREKPENIGYGILESIAERLAAMAKGIHPEEKVVFTGGGALNPLLVKILGEKLHTTVYASKYPQLTGAFGAALAAMELVHAEIPRTRAA